MFGRGKSGSARPAPAQPYSGRRFLCRPLQVTRIDNHSRVVLVPGAPPGVIEDDLLPLAEGLQSWATFDEHLERLASAGLSLTGNELAGALERIHRLGALWFDDEFLHACAGLPPREPASIATMVWCTRERPKLLARSIKSFLSAREEGKAPRIIVCDDSLDAEAARKTREALLESAAGGAVPPERCMYVGVAEKQRIIEALGKRCASKGVSPEVVEFILSNRSLPASEGANRNFALLLTAGEAFHSTDDDTLSRAAFGSDPGGLELSSAFNPTVTDIFDSDMQCAEFPATDCSILSRHESLLGRGVGDLVRGRRQSDAHLGSCSAAFSRELASGGGSIVVTSAGTLGDSGFGNPRAIFHLEGDRRARYVEDIEVYARARLSRIMFRRAERPVLTDSPWLLTLNFAVDNRELVPPTFPFGRNSDGLLGVVIRFCRPADFIAHLACGVRHIPPEPRTFSEPDLHAFAPRVCDFMIHSAQTVRAGPHVRMTGDRIAALGAHFRGFGRLSAHDFDEAVRSVWMAFADRYIAGMESRLEAHGHAPAPWAEDVEKHIESILEFLRGSAPLFPREFSAAGQPATIHERRELFRRSVRLFGDSLDAWPTLRELALKEPFLFRA